MPWLIWLGLLFFCYVSLSSSESVKYPPPPPPICEPSIPTKHNCIGQSCTCGWCLPEDGHQTEKDHDPTGNCFVHSDHPEYIKKMCGSVNSTVYTNLNSKFCHVTNIITISLIGIYFSVIIIVCMISCPLMALLLICMCYKECRGEDTNYVTIETIFNQL